MNKLPDYFRDGKTIISAELLCKSQCLQFGDCCFPDCSKDVKEFPSINSAKKRSIELRKSGKIVKKLWP